MSFIQASTPGIEGTGVTTVASSGSAVGTGHGVVGFIYWLVASGTPTVVITDNAGSPNTYTKPDAIYTDSASSGVQAIHFYLTNVPGNPTTLTATFSGGTVSFGEFGWCEFSTELGSGVVIDQHTITDKLTSTGTNGYFTANVTTAVNGELVFAWAATTTTGVATLTPGTVPAFTIGMNDGANQFYSEHLVQAAASSTTAGVWTATDATTRFFLGLMTFKPAGGASCSGKLMLMGVGCGIAAKKLEENPILTRRSLLLPAKRSLILPRRSMMGHNGGPPLDD